MSESNRRQFLSSSAAVLTVFPAIAAASKIANDRIRVRAGKFIGDDEANRLLRRQYRAGFVVPEKV